MIKSSTARRMGIKFFKQQNLGEYADMLKTSCLDRVFGELVEKLGKRRVFTLYSYLPKQLRHYVLFIVTHAGIDFDRLDCKYKRVRDSKRPERLKTFQAYMQEAQEVVLKFLTS